MRKVLAVLGVATVIVSAAAPAAAQDAGLAGALATGVEMLGQGLGESARSGSSVFVTARGQARLPASVQDVFSLALETTSTSAVEAARERDQKLAVIKAAAARRQIDVEYGPSTISTSIDQQAVNARHAKTAKPGVFDASPPLDSEIKFAATANLTFAPRPGANLAAFLDELRASDISLVKGAGANAGLGSLFGLNQLLGIGTQAKIDPSVWDEATRDAVREAQHQAEVIASASGRKLGAARQVTVVSRTAAGDAAYVSVAVRYDFAAP